MVRSQVRTESGIAAKSSRTNGGIDWITVKDEIVIVPGLICHVWRRQGEIDSRLIPEF